MTRSGCYRCPGFPSHISCDTLHVEQELLSLPEHMCSPPVSSGVSAARSLVFCVVFCGSLFVLFLLVINTARVRERLCKLQKGGTRLAVASDKVYQLLAHGRWFSPGTPASSTTKTGRHDIAEILLKVALKHQNSKSIKSSGHCLVCLSLIYGILINTLVS